MSHYSVTTPAKRHGARHASVAGGSLKAPGRVAYTHQVLRRGNNTLTNIDMFDIENSCLDASQMMADQSFHRSDLMVSQRKNLNSTRGLEVIRDETMTTDRSDVLESSSKELSNAELTAGRTQYLLCQLFLTMMSNEERLMKAKADFMDLRFDLTHKFQQKFSPIMLFQRIDRANKGHLTRDDVLNFLQENGFTVGNGYSKADLKLVFS